MVGITTSENLLCLQLLGGRLTCHSYLYLGVLFDFNIYLFILFIPFIIPFHIQLIIHSIPLVLYIG